jgi:hypothetical protein
MIENALDYLIRTENAVRVLLQEAAFYKATIRSIQDTVSRSDTAPEMTTAFGDWWMKNKNDKNAILKAHREYSTEAFTGGILAGSVLKIAAHVIEFYSGSTTVPDEWKKLFKRRILPDRFFVGRTIHTVPVGLIIYCGLNQYINTPSRLIEEINQEVFGRLGASGGQFEFLAFVDRSNSYRSLHSEYLAANVLDVLGWSDYNAYIEDMQQILI